ncbi:unnamed protein product [Rotaria magnacalcarata]|uniref:Transmembrane protein 185A n=1 Tax=Rotaria magnacalcarata TaxID=392030 RepID=A0A814PKF7_9BILA|nr:unnamed protein product [Rotaria magnacalcarata]CAF1287836.1 unnamed protein product [Rotaria magnacalcarata]CAF2121594.1 unnamed protein product [Rotaria magnacalcarata]
MDTSRCIQSCNPSRFVVSCSLLIFSILFALRIDEYIKISYWLVFLPLFIWKFLVVFGACIGIFVWCKNGDGNRIIRTPDNDCQALIIYFVMHILLLIFELLICDKLENRLETRWITCFTPLLICILISSISCLWSLKAQRNFLIQGFISANGLLFLFFPFRLDYFITWRYVIVFIPIWISLCVALIFIVVKFILAIIYRCSQRALSNYRELSTITEAITYVVLFIPFSTFLILLVNRLDCEDADQTKKLSFTVIAVPLWIALIAWLTLSFGATDTNPWWFGLQRSLCEIILEQCPSLSIYFNNRFRFASDSSRNDSMSGLTISTAAKNIETIDANKLTIVNTNNEKNLTSQDSSMSLSEPD